MHGDGVFSWSDGKSYKGYTINFNNLEHLKKINLMDTEFLNGLMELYIKDIGLMEK